jgi:drug/metabolite transporter (DMT)-like permease
MRHSERSGLIWALCGFALLSGGDAVVKTMAGQWAPTAIAATRYVIGLSGLSLLLLIKEGKAGFAMPLPGLQMLRGFGVGISTLGFFSAISFMPLATATSITFTSPMITALLAALFLGEPARRDTWIATVVAFVGVLIVLRPNLAALGLAALLPLVCAAGMSLLMIGNRATAGKASPLASQFFVALFATPLLVIAALVGASTGSARLAITAPDWSLLARCAVVAVSASTAHWAIYQGTVRAGAATIAPMTYVQLLVATALGFVFFGDAPDLVALLGAALIVGSGLWLWHVGRWREPGATD